jgi:hypothetical protein
VLGWVTHIPLPQQSTLLTRYNHNEGSATSRQENSSESRQVRGQKIGSQEDRYQQEGQIRLHLWSWQG